LPETLILEPELQAKRCPVCARPLSIVESKLVPAFFDSKDTGFFFYCSKCRMASAVPKFLIEEAFAEKKVENHA
jgi:uncharacterized protein with PIN domain